jgi:epsilon-lactone hydrolase
MQNFPLPDTVSVEFRLTLEGLVGALSNEPAPTLPVDARDIEGFARQRRTIERVFEHLHGRDAMRFAGRLEEEHTAMAGVPVTWFRPLGRNPKDGVVLWIHGGGYTLGSSALSAPGVRRLACAAALPVVAADYTLAPEARWQHITDELMAVYDRLLNDGTSSSHIAICGDSAGGSLAAGLTLKMRDAGRPLPGALVMWSPWADISERGDTTITLKEADFLSYEALTVSAAAYADPADHRHPVVSPVYGDFRPGFPPALVQCGTREIFLSHSVRLVQAIEDADQTAVLELYEGMPHVHQQFAPDCPEAARAITRSARFIRRHLALDARVQ